MFESKSCVSEPENWNPSLQHTQSSCLLPADLFSPHENAFWQRLPSRPRKGFKNGIRQKRLGIRVSERCPRRFAHSNDCAMEQDRHAYAYGFQWMKSWNSRPLRLVARSRSEPASNLANIVVDATAGFCQIQLGRCSSRKP